MKRGGDVREILDISAVVWCHSHECSDVRQRRRCRKILDCLDFLWIWVDSICWYNMSQKLDRFPSELTFGSLELQASCSDSMQDLLQSLLMYAIARLNSASLICSVLFWLINIHVFDYPDSRLSGIFTLVPPSPDNRGWTVPRRHRHVVIMNVIKCICLTTQDFLLPH